jgi:putative ABC transport system substrate-binding protein
MRLSPVGLVAALAFAALVAPLAAHAQPPGKVFRVGLLLPNRAYGSPAHLDCQQQLQELGDIDGQNLALEVRAAAGQFERLPGLAAELVRLHVDVIVASGPEATRRAARDAPETIPIVMRALDYDPMALGYVAVLWDEASADQRRTAEAAAGPVGVQLQPLALRQPPYECAGAFAAAAQGQAEALVVLNAPIFFRQSAPIVALAARSRLPTMFSAAASARAGGLMAYDVHRGEIERRAATYVDKFLKDAQPADLPIEQPTKFALVLNLKTAQALGITFPPTLLVLADEVIQ